MHAKTSGCRSLAIVFVPESGLGIFASTPHLTSSTSTILRQLLAVCACEREDGRRGRFQNQGRRRRARGGGLTACPDLPFTSISSGPPAVPLDHVNSFWNIAGLLLDPFLIKVRTRARVSVRTRVTAMPMSPQGPHVMHMYILPSTTMLTVDFVGTTHSLFAS